jgi:hypothetical protein
MKLHTALCILTFAGCATAPSPRATNVSEAALEDGGGGPAGGPQQAEYPVRLETPAGTFLVSPHHAEDFAKALSGQPTQTHFFAGAE